MAANTADPSLRVMFIIGGLGKGGAEKQLVYMLRALKNEGVNLRLVSLTGGEFHEQSVEALGLSARAVGALNPAARVAAILREVRQHQPHFLQATHFFASFYAGLAGRLSRTPSIGAIRGDFHHDLQGVGRSAKLLLNLPTIFLANSFNARENAVQAGLPAGRVHVLQNVIDLRDFDRRAAEPVLNPLPNPDRCRVITVARLMPVKRLERFLHGLAIARKQAPEIEGIIVGGGPEEMSLRKLAAELELENGGLRFLGERTDIPELLSQSGVFVLTSEREGFPNVLLEAMAASLPVVTTPAGESRELIQDGVNGYLVPFDDHAALGARLVELARSPARRSAMGKAGRAYIESRFTADRLGPAMMEMYSTVASQARSAPAERALTAYHSRERFLKSSQTGSENIRGSKTA